MKRLARLVAVGVVGMVLGLTFAGVAGAAVLMQSPAPASDPYRDVKVTSGSAIAAVRAIADRQQRDPSNGQLAGSQARSQAQAVWARVASVRTADIAATGPFDGKMNRYYKVEGADLSAVVDAHDGHVSQLLLISRTPTSPASTAMSSDQAQTIASDYLADQGISTEGLGVKVELIDRGAFQMYSVTWQRDVDGVMVPDSRLVQLDAGTGVVFNVHNIHRPYSAPAAATVTRDQAVASAQKAATTAAQRTSASYSVIDATLQVTFSEQGAQQLVWIVKLYASDLGNSSGYFLVSVDATTGGATITGRG